MTIIMMFKEGKEWNATSSIVYEDNNKQIFWQDTIEIHENIFWKHFKDVFYILSQDSSID